MDKLTHVTFTGVDERTDIGRLIDIARRYPFAEFGILFSAHNAENGNRYPEIIPLLKELDKRGVRLSAHLCGHLVREIVKTGDFTGFRRACGIRADMFARCQLNVAGASNCTPTRFLYFPSTMKQVIIQQKTREVFEGKRDGGRSLWYHFSTYNPICSLLLDDSGGAGVRGEFRYFDAPHVGYAGGIGPDNVTEVLEGIAASPVVRDCWIDMEGRVRTDDWFDLEKVSEVCERVERFLKAS